MLKNLIRLFIWGCLLLGIASCSSSGNPFEHKRSEIAATPLLIQSARTVNNGIATGSDTEVSTKALADMRVLSNDRNQSVYLIGSSDLLEVKVFQAEELSREVRVDQRGNITLPLLGSIRVSGLSKESAEKRLAELMGKDLLRNPQVSVFIKEFTAQRVTVEGEVKNQGVYPLKGSVTVLQALAMAGGLTDLAAANDVVLFRTMATQNRSFSIDLRAIRSGLVADPFLKNDDRIVIKKVEEKRVTVDGEVKKSGVFTFKEPTTVMQAIALAQGLSNLASPDKVVVFRRELDGERAYSVNLAEIRNGAVPDPYIKSGDRIVVGRSNSRYWLKEVAPLLSPLNVLTRIF